MLQPISPRGRLLDAAGACALMPVLRREQVLGAVYEPDASDMDVHAIHQGYLRGIRRAGGSVVSDAPTSTSLRRERRRVAGAAPARDALRGAGGGQRGGRLGRRDRRARRRPADRPRSRAAARPSSSRRPAGVRARAGR